MKTPLAASALRQNDAPAAAGTARTGQILAMFAIMLTALLAAVGLSVDLGLSFSERRSMQNAADAGALAGARVVVRNTSATPLSAQSDVESVARSNAMPLGAINSIDCTYLNDAGTSLGSCGALVPTGATGVEVTVTETHPTFFIRVVPGAPNTVTTSAHAKANVLKLRSPSDGPFLPCASNTQLVGGGTLDILIEQDGKWIINPAAINKDFIIHGPQIEKCNAQASRYKGVADQSDNRERNPPGWFKYKEGDTAGPVSADVEGADGCKAGQEINNCVAFLPIVISDPSETDNNRQMWAVAFAPFYITAPKSNEHYGKLLSEYVVYGRGETGNWGWTPGYTGPIVIRLTG